MYLQAQTGPLNPARVREEVSIIDQAKGDYEVAHSFEDALYRDVLAAIADGACTDPAECARIALTTQALDFPRYTS